MGLHQRKPFLSEAALFGLVRDAVSFEGSTLKGFPRFARFPLGPLHPLSQRMDTIGGSAPAARLLYFAAVEPIIVLFLVIGLAFTFPVFGSFAVFFPLVAFLDVGFKFILDMSLNLILGGQSHTDLSYS